MGSWVKKLTAPISIGWLKAVISIVAIGVIVIRLIFPELKIDAITLGLIVIAVLPWLSELIDTAKFPGGWEVKFRDLREAGARVTSGVSPKTNFSTTTDKPNFLVVAEHDPNLALVALRIEIEKRLREYARLHDIDGRRPLRNLLQDLAKREVLPADTVGGLNDLVSAGNNAAHGARVQDGVSEWALDVGPRILAALDKHLQ